MLHSLTLFFAQVTNAASAAGTTENPVDAAAQNRPGWTIFVFYALIFILVYFTFFRPQIQAKKKQEELMKGSKTGDRIITTGGIHGVITNVKDTTVIIKVADNVKIELEKSHIDKVVRESADSEKPVAAKVS